MGSFLSESICLARNGDSDQWMQILVFVVIAVIYGLGAILKARQRKEQAAGGETAARARVRRRPVERPLPRRPAVATVPPQKRVEMRKSPPVPAPPKSVEVGPVPAVKAGYEQRQFAAVQRQPVYLSELLSGYPDIAELRKAILYHEIFGKPLSLRAPGQHIIGL
jgi:type IV secretory pathway VirB10-like protein